MWPSPPSRRRARAPLHAARRRRSAVGAGRGRGAGRRPLGAVRCGARDPPVRGDGAGPGDGAVVPVRLRDVLHGRRCGRAAPLLVPDGRLPSRAWRPIARDAGLTIAGETLWRRSHRVRSRGPATSRCRSTRSRWPPSRSWSRPCTPSPPRGAQLCGVRRGLAGGALPPRHRRHAAPTSRGASCAGSPSAPGSCRRLRGRQRLPSPRSAGTRGTTVSVVGAVLGPAGADSPVAVAGATPVAAMLASPARRTVTIP